MDSKWTIPHRIGLVRAAIGTVAIVLAGRLVLRASTPEAQP